MHLSEDLIHRGVISCPDKNGAVLKLLQLRSHCNHCLIRVAEVYFIQKGIIIDIQLSCLSFCLVRVFADILVFVLITLFHNTTKLPLANSLICHPEGEELSVVDSHL